MNSCKENNNSNTPRRRQLGVRKSYKTQASDKLNYSVRKGTLLKQSLNLTITERCESPPLPCNQVEYILGESANNSISSDIPCSSGISDTCLMRDVNWDSFEHNNLETVKVDSPEPVTCSNNIEAVCKNVCNQNDDFFSSYKCQKLLRDEIEESFDMINESICNNNNDINKSLLFETKDSFLLDIGESDILAAEAGAKANNITKINSIKNVNSFYDLPLIAKGLFKTYRNIEKFYDWQEECLNLDAIKQRRNLIYALPTSGGKTLVAEVLMLREVLNRKHNALFILPFVALVQEKIFSLAPFALQLEFLIEEYAAGKGHLPPKKRRKKNSIYIATIEKGLALVRSLIELNRLNEIGLLVVDELHLIGEPGRGGTLETLLTTVIFANKDIQIVGMSATIGNIPDIARFLKADVYEKQFRPVELTEYVKLGDVLYRIGDGMELVVERKLSYDYSPAALSLDPDFLGGLVSEVVPHASCLVFCPTKRNCENVAALLCQIQRKDMSCHRVPERRALALALRGEGAAPGLVRGAALGVGYHHAGLAPDERALVEQAFRSGVVSVLCCTSTLAAGVNLPARRVVVRAPLVGRRALSAAAYRQMVGRAGRAGVCEAGESVLVVSPREWGGVRERLARGPPPALSWLRARAAELLLSGVALGLCARRGGLRALLGASLLAVAPADGEVDVDAVCDDSIRSLLQSGALEVEGKKTPDVMDDDMPLAVSALGKASIKGCLDLNTTKQLLHEIEVAARGLVLMGGLHLLYLVTPHEPSVRPDYRHYYSLYSNLDEEGMQTAKVLGITEVNAVRMMTGKPITNIPESVLSRFYVALMLRDVYRQIPFAAVSDKYLVPRGSLHALVASAAGQCCGAARACGELSAGGGGGAWWEGCGALFERLALRLRHCGAPELEALLELPGVRRARALQLRRAGCRRLEDVARASPRRLQAEVTHLTRTAADQLVSAARVMLIEKVENLRADAEDVMEELNK